MLHLVLAFPIAGIPANPALAQDSDSLGPTDMSITVSSGRSDDLRTLRRMEELLSEIRGYENVTVEVRDGAGEWDEGREAAEAGLRNDTCTQTPLVVKSKSILSDTICIFWSNALGEKKNRSLRRNEIISSAERCIYCDSLEATTVEHMPPRGIFEAGTRPSGWEFASCKTCNESTRGSDAVAQFFAMLSVFDLPDWKGSKIRKLPGALSVYAPGFIEEVFGKRPWQEKLIKKNGLLRPVKITRADGPLAKQHLDLFSAKISMAGFAHLVGRPMKTNGVIFLQWFLNGGMNFELYEAITRIMPVHGQIEQGRKKSGEQFFFRYNTDMKNIVAAIYNFHGALSILSIATDGDEFLQPISDMFSSEEIKDRETANLVFADIARWRTVYQA